MQNGRTDINIAQPNSRGHRSYGVRVAAARRFFDVSLFLPIFNAELTVLSARLMPSPPPINN